MNYLCCFFLNIYFMVILIFFLKINMVFLKIYYKVFEIEIDLNWVF